jgi:hypothetical protein
MSDEEFAAFIEAHGTRDCQECGDEFIPDRPSRWLCKPCRYDPSDGDDPMEANMDCQMLHNIGMGE